MTRSYMGYVSSLTTNTVVVQGYGTATGGTSSSITVGGVNYTLLTFTSSGTLTVTKAGLFDVMMCGAGAGGGDANANGVGGGGGAGQIVQATVYLSANQTIVIGAGGTANTNGEASYFDSIRELTAAGGGWGGSYNAAKLAGTGGSGGGGIGRAEAAWIVIGNAIANAITGYNGGVGNVSNNTGGGGGGGGATALGAAGTASAGGNGGAGYDVSAFIGGSALFKAGGGGGGRGSTGTTVGSGGSSIGGNGGANTSGSSASANTASGGGGAGNSGTGGSGGSGIVYIRFKA